MLRSAGARTRVVAAPGARPAIASNAVYLFSSVAIGSRERDSSGGWGEFVHLGALQGLRSQGRPVLIPGSGIPDDATIAALLRERPIGVLMPESMLTGSTDERLARAAVTLSAAGIPTVVYGELPDGCDRVCSDHEGGAYALSRWLIERGHRRQLCLWFQAQAQAQPQLWPLRRQAGHARALREIGCPPPPIEWIRWNGDEQARDDQIIAVAGHLAPYLLAAEPIEAVMAMTDGQLPVIHAALRRCGREPGRDITVVGYDAYWNELPEFRHDPVPPAATVDKLNLDLGRAMAALLEERIAGRLPSTPQERLIAPRLVIT